MRYRLQRHDGTDCSATMVPITVLRMVPIQRYRHISIEKGIKNKGTKWRILIRKFLYEHFPFSFYMAYEHLLDIKREKVFYHTYKRFD